MATIVCIDDDPSVLVLHKMLLETDGHTVLSASNGPEGITLCRQNRADVLIVDYRMPGMDGDQVAEVLRKEQPRLPIVLCTGCAQDVPESVKGLATLFVEKGDGPGALLAVVQILLRARATAGWGSDSQIGKLSLPDWQKALQAALTEPDPERLPERIDVALHAIRTRLRMLSQRFDVEGERHAMGDALSRLQALLQPSNRRKYA